ncbi:MAG: hypothetical protein LBI77_01890 [Puniceicoccales bacterium]|jgi:hypothetical protein|nr:hypothetical protein [Puniceicoccales bacterium]
MNNFNVSNSNSLDRLDDFLNKKITKNGKKTDNQLDLPFEGIASATYRITKKPGGLFMKPRIIVKKQINGQKASKTVFLNNQKWIKNVKNNITQERCNALGEHLKNANLSQKDRSEIIRELEKICDNPQMFQNIKNQANALLQQDAQNQQDKCNSICSMLQSGIFTNGWNREYVLQELNRMYSDPNTPQNAKDQASHSLWQDQCNKFGTDLKTPNLSPKDRSEIIRELEKICDNPQMFQNIKNQANALLWQERCKDLGADLKNENLPQKDRSAIIGKLKRICDNPQMFQNIKNQANALLWQDEQNQQNKCNYFSKMLQSGNFENDWTREKVLTELGKICSDPNTPQNAKNQASCSLWQDQCNKFGEQLKKANLSQEKRSEIIKNLMNICNNFDNPAISLDIKNQAAQLIWEENCKNFGIQSKNRLEIIEELKNIYFNQNMSQNIQKQNQATDLLNIDLALQRNKCLFLISMLQSGKFENGLDKTKVLEELRKIWSDSNTSLDVKYQAGTWLNSKAMQ